jgi:tetratricopeptide (TPR) repeat protein
MQWTSIEANVAIPESAFSPPLLPLTPLQRLLDQLYSERADVDAVLWSYADFRQAFPAVESDAGIQAIGYQMLKMGDMKSAVALLQANATDYPRSSGAAFGLGRAYCGAGRREEGRAALARALELDPANARAKGALARCEAPS